MLKLSKYMLSVAFAICFCGFGCTPDKKVVEPTLQQPVSTIPAMKSAVVSTPDSKPLLPEIDLEVYAYPKAIADQENLLLETEDVVLKRDANLTLVVLHMSRVNPNQDFGAASEALGRAVELDSSLGNDISIQHWLDVFSLLHKMQEGYELAGQLQGENATLRALLKKQKKTITYLEMTLEELKKVESDVEKKRRRYR